MKSTFFRIAYRSGSTTTSVATYELEYPEAYPESEVVQRHNFLINALRSINQNGIVALRGTNKTYLTPESILTVELDGYVPEIMNKGSRL